MEVSVQLHAPAALPPGKEPLVPDRSEAGWVPEPYVILITLFQLQKLGLDNTWYRIRMKSIML